MIRPVESRKGVVSFLRSLLVQKQPPMVGLDISSSSVKLVELQIGPDGGYILARHASEPFGKGWVIDGQIEKFDEVTRAIKKGLIKSGSRCKHAAMAMPQSSVITKKIMLPAGLTEDELEIQVESEANQYIPFSLDEINLDFCVVGPSPKFPDDVEVMIAASRKERVQDRQALAEAAGLKAVVLDIESHASRLALSRIISNLPGQSKEHLIALFEIGAETSSLKVLRDTELLYDRDQPFGGAQLTQMISRQYGFSFQEAEEKKLSGNLPKDFGTVTLTPFIETASQEISRALKYFFSSTSHHKVQYVLLSGGTASLPGMRDRVGQLTGFNCEVVNPFINMKLASEIKGSKLNREASSYLTACGLAMRRFV